MKRALQIGALVTALTLGSPVLAQESNNCEEIVDMMILYTNQASEVEGLETYTIYYTDVTRNPTDAEMECIKSGIRKKSNGRYSTDIGIKDGTYKIDTKINKQD